MKILEVNKYFYLRRGAERHFLDLRDMLEKGGHTVAVFSMDAVQNIPCEFSKYFVSYVGYNSDDATFLERLKGIGRIFWSFEARKKMKKLLEVFQPDVVHLHNIYHQLSPSILGPIKSLHIPMVMTVHDYNLISPDKDKYYPEVGKHYWKFLCIKKYSFGKRVLLVLKKYWEEWCGFYEKNIDTYIVPSVYVQQICVEAGIPEEKIVVLPHFIREQEENEQPSKLPGWIPQKYVLYGGSISKEKGVDRLISICEKSRIPLVLAGMCENGFSVHSTDIVTSLGKQTKEQMKSLMQNASCVVSASSLPETFGLLALEAGSLGKPFFGIKTGALGEIIVNGKNGFLASDIETLSLALNEFFSGKKAFDTVAIQRETLERFSEKVYLKQLETLFRSL